MRIVKLSPKVFGFDTVEACTAYFEHVVPWQKDSFYFAGEGHPIAKDGLQSEEIVVFSYSGNIVCVAKTKELLINDDDIPVGIQIHNSSKKIFYNTPKLVDLEGLLHSLGYNSKVVGAQGWNIIEQQYEKQVIDFIMKHDWSNYL
jgi:hypothetical protein